MERQARLLFARFARYGKENQEVSVIVELEFGEFCSRIASKIPLKLVIERHTD